MVDRGQVLVRNPAGEVHAIGDAELAGALLDSHRFRATASDTHEFGLAAGLLEGLGPRPDDVVEVLVRLGIADEQRVGEVEP